MFGKKKKKKKKSKKPLLIVCASIGLVVAGTSILLYVMNKNSD